MDHNSNVQILFILITTALLQMPSALYKDDYKWLAKGIPGRRL